MEHPWEESRGMGFSYGYNRAERIEHYHTGRQLVAMLVDLVSRGGNLLLDIAVLRSLNIHIVLVHGAGHQIKLLSERLHEPISNHDGTGVTDAATLSIAITAATNVTHEILEGLKLNDIRAAQTNAIESIPLGIIKGIDHQHTGKVHQIDVGLLRTLLVGVTPTDVPTLIAVTCVLASVAVCACALPARCATTVNLTEALRSS